MIKSFFQKLLISSVVILLIVMAFPIYDILHTSKAESPNVPDKNLNTQNTLEETPKIPQKEFEIQTLNASKIITQDVYTIKILATRELENLEYYAQTEQGFYYKYKVKVTQEGYNDYAFKYFEKEYGEGELSFWLFRKYSEYEEIKPFLNSQLIKEPVTLTTLVNKENRLKRDYAPKDLVFLSEYDINANRGVQLRKDAAKKLSEMIAQMYKSGIKLTVSSGYRSYTSQEDTYIYWLNRNRGDIQRTDVVSAKPSHSEHQLGTVVDLVDSETNYTVKESFADSPAGKWLIKNAYKYGYVMSYSSGSENITGYKYEPWHWRYIGIKNAKDYRSFGLTLTEYLKMLKEIQ